MWSEENPYPRFVTEVLQKIVFLTYLINHFEMVFSLKCLVLCFRLHFAKDTTIGNTAGATVRQLVSLVFERVVIEDCNMEDDSSNEEVSPKLEQENSFSDVVDKQQDFQLKTLKPFALDAFSLFQVLTIF